MSHAKRPVFLNPYIIIRARCERNQSLVVLFISCIRRSQFVESAYQDTISTQSKLKVEKTNQISFAVVTKMVRPIFVFAILFQVISASELTDIEEKWSSMF